MEFFAGAIEKATSQLLTRVAADYNLPLEDLVAKYLSKAVKPKVVKPKVPKVPMEERPMCPGFSGKKKTPCKNRCKPGLNACHLHGTPTGPEPICQPCVPQVPAQEMEKAVAALGDAANSLATVLAAAPAPAPVAVKPKKPRVVKPKVVAAPAPVAAVVPEVAPDAVPVPAPAPAPVSTVEDSLNDRLLAILQSGGVLDDEEEPEEPEFEEPLSPGAERHKSILESKGQSWADYYDDEEEELGEEDLID
jgi:hypothetical protein